MTDPMRTIDAHGEIMAQMAVANDETHRNFLILMLGILDNQTAQYETLNRKLDTIIGDEKAMRATVLNGHAETHHDHHDWIARKIAEEKGEADQAKSIKQQFLEAVVSQAGVIVVTALAAVAGVASWVK